MIFFRNVRVHWKEDAQCSSAIFRSVTDFFWDVFRARCIVEIVRSKTFDLLFEKLSNSYYSQDHVS